MRNVDFNTYNDTFDDEVQRSVGFAGKNADFYTKVKVDAFVDIAQASRFIQDHLKSRSLGSGGG